MTARKNKRDIFDFFCIVLAGCAFGCIIFMFFPTVCDLVHLNHVAERVAAADNAFWAQYGTEKPPNIFAWLYVNYGRLLIYAKNAIEYGITGVIVGGFIGAAIANTAEKRNA